MKTQPFRTLAQTMTQRLPSTLNASPRHLPARKFAVGILGIALLCTAALPVHATDVPPPPAPPAPPATESADLQAAREKLQAAQQQLGEAARELARLYRESGEESPFSYAYEFINNPDRAMLGVTIAPGPHKDGRMTGVRVTGVTPGSGADKAGLKANDLLVSVNGQSLDVAAGEARNSMKTLRDFMATQKPDDVVTVEYLRDDRKHSAKVTATRPEHAIGEAPMMTWKGRGDVDLLLPMAPMAPPAPRAPWPRQLWIDDAGLKLARIDDHLAEYFKTKDGVLVLEVPEEDPLGLRSGDVIRKINGRSVASPRAAWDELGEVRGDTPVKLDITRKGKMLSLQGPLPQSLRMPARRVMLHERRIEQETEAAKP